MTNEEKVIIKKQYQSEVDYQLRQKHIDKRDVEEETENNFSSVYKEYWQLLCKGENMRIGNRKELLFEKKKDLYTFGHYTVYELKCYIIEKENELNIEFDSKYYGQQFLYIQRTNKIVDRNAA
jgi:hypothetical protein